MKKSIKNRNTKKTLKRQPKKVNKQKQPPKKINNKAEMQFSLSQRNAIEMGSEVRQELLEIVDEACDPKNTMHTYIYSTPGLGKTHAVTAALTKRDEEFYTVSGNISMFAFCVKICVIDHHTPKNTKVVINVDDCDEILKTEQNINIIKGILEGERILRYEKSMQSQMSSLTPAQVEAVEAHANPNSMGFEVNCKNMKFIFTSNKKLPTKADIERKPTPLNNHLHAIRSRCHTKDFDHKWDVVWGWIVDVALSQKLEFVKELNPEQKMILLDWMYNNWQGMNEASIRTVIKMAQKMLNKPNGYRTSWELTYLNTNKK